MRIQKSVTVFSLIMLLSNSVFAQDDGIDRWDNWLLIGNKIVFGGQTNFQHSHELQ